MFAARIRVTIAHPTPLLCAGLEAAISTQDDFEVVTADLADPNFDPTTTVVTDCETGLHLTLCRYAPGNRILIVTHDQGEANIRRAMAAGIRGYLLLTASLDVVIGAIRSIHHGGTVLDPLVAAKLAESFVRASLTSREVDVLRLLMLGIGDKAIAKRLALRVDTVKAHLKAVRAKLNASTRTEAVAIAQRRGLIPDAHVVPCAVANQACSADGLLITSFRAPHAVSR